MMVFCTDVARAWTQFKSIGQLDTSLDVFEDSAIELGCYIRFHEFLFVELAQQLLNYDDIP